MKAIRVYEIPEDEAFMSEREGTLDEWMKDSTTGDEI